MAVIESEPNLKAEIRVNHDALTEYHDDEKTDELSSVTKYIEATAGAKFGVYWKFDSQFAFKHDVKVSVYVDGHPASGNIFEVEKSKRYTDKWFSSKGAREQVGDQRYIREFVFSQFSADEVGDVSSARDELFQRLKRVGLITLKFQWATVTGLIPSYSHEAPNLTKIVEKIPEKALKGRALSNQVTLGERRLVASHSFMDCKVIGDPFAVYNFKYRSQKDLQSLLIIPRDISPRPRGQLGAGQINERDSNQARHTADNNVNSRGTHRVKIEASRRNGSQTVKTERIKRERSMAETDMVVNLDDEVNFVSSSKRRRLAVTINEEGVETIDLT